MVGALDPFYRTGKNRLEIQLSRHAFDIAPIAFEVDVLAGERAEFLEKRLFSRYREAQ
jgi:hypothetical protein